MSKERPVQFPLGTTRTCDAQIKRNGIEAMACQHKIRDCAHEDNTHFRSFPVSDNKYHLSLFVQLMRSR